MIVENFKHARMKAEDEKTQYIRYRIGRLKHQYWLWNRKNPNLAYIDEYDFTIIKNCKPGITTFFGCAGYYLKDIYPDIEVIEQYPIVKKFYPNVHLCKDRSKLAEVIPFKCDNFAVNNNRADHWVTVDGLTNHLYNYSRIMNPGCRVFYSFRDTQIHVNRLNTDLEKHFLNWAKSLEEKIGFKLIWSDIQFPKKTVEDDYSENPDTTNGNLKFMFVYQYEEGRDNWEPNFS